MNVGSSADAAPAPAGLGSEIPQPDADNMDVTSKWRAVQRSGRSMVGLLVLAIALLGCDPGSRAAPSLHVDIAVSPTPPIEGPGRVIVMVEDSLGQPVSDATVAVEGQTEETPAVTHRATPEPGGRYVVDAFPFYRSGEWTVRAIAIRAADTVVVVRRWTVSGR